MSNKPSGNTVKKQRLIACNPLYSHNQTFTVGSGISPDLLSLVTSLQKDTDQAPAGYMLGMITAGGDLHPALRTSTIDCSRVQILANLPQLCIGAGAIEAVIYIIFERTMTKKTAS